MEPFALSEPEPPVPDETSIPDRFRVDLTGVTLLGTYRVEKKLAEGGMGSIYLAEDENLGRKVVVKVPHPRFLTEAGFRERLALEVQELVRLEHPHITRIIARGEHEEVPFFVLQYLGGGSLEDRLHEGGTQSPNEVLTWLPTMARTLDFVHERGILHRDVKPGNILFDEADNVFLSDFGVAKALGEEGASVTATGVGIGSPRYMAPEQAVGGDVGPFSDQYGLGSTVYEALTGEPPFTGEQAVQILVRKAKEEPPDIAERIPDQPPAAAEAVMRSIARLPPHRFDSCEAFAKAFAHALGVGTSDTTQIPAQTASAPRPTLRVGTGEGPPPHLAPPPARPRSARRVLYNLIAVAVVAAALFGAFRSSDQQDEGGPAPTPPPEAPPAQRVGEVELISRGTEPRRELTYRVVAGARERLIMQMSSASRMSSEGKHRVFGFAPVVFEIDVIVDEVQEDGTILFHWILTKARSESDKPRAAAVTQALLDDLVGLEERGQVTRHGHRIAVEKARKGEVDPLTEEVLASLRLGMTEFVTPLPSEPIGIGATWMTTRSLTNMYTRMTQTTNYELMEVEGYRIHVQAESVLAAPKQTMESPWLGDNKGRVRVDALHGQSSQDLRLDLSQLVPRGLFMESHGTFTTVAEDPDGDVETTVEFRNEMELGRR